jgi:RNA polymerase sigma-70 factor (ECF subfamily)
MQTTSDEALIGRIAAGDKLAMQVLFARHHVRVYRFVSGWWANRQGGRPDQ